MIKCHFSVQITIPHCLPFAPLTKDSSWMHVIPYYTPLKIVKWQNATGQYKSPFYKYNACYLHHSLWTASRHALFHITLPLKQQNATGKHKSPFWQCLPFATFTKSSQYRMHVTPRYTTLNWKGKKLPVSSTHHRSTVSHSHQWTETDSNGVCFKTHSTEVRAYDKFQTNLVAF